MNAQSKKILAVMLCLSIAACSSTPENEIDNSDMLADAELALDGPAATPESTDEFADDFGAEFGGEESAFEESAPVGDSAPADDFSDEFSEEFAEEPAAMPAEESFEDEFAAFEEEEPAAAPIEEEPAIAEEDLFAEEPTETFTAEDFTSPEPIQMANPVSVQSIDFIANQNGGTLQVKTSGVATYNGRFNPETNQYVLEINNATLEPQVKRPYIMKDFQTAFGAVNSYQNAGGSTARIVVQMKNAGEPVVQQDGDKILLVANAEAPTSSQMNTMAASEASATQDNEAWKSSYNVAEAEKQEKILGARTLEEFLAGNTKFFGRPISIQVDDAEIRDVINFIADESGVNLVLSDDVKGNISLKLRQIPWDQALVIVMRSKGLGYVRQGSVLRITQLSQLQAETKAAQEIVDAQNKLTPLKVKVIPVSYAIVGDLQKQVEPFLTVGRGKVVSDSRTSSLIITDTPDVLGRVERLVQELDIPPAQVMIEGKIVEATESFSKRVGVNWGFTGVPTEISSGGGFDGNPVQISPTFGSNPLNQTNIAGLSSNMTLNIGTLDFIGNLNAQLGLAQSDSLVKVVSSPRIVTMNRVEASISQKGEILNTVTVNDNGVTNTNVDRTPIELRLGVTPQITAEGSVILDVDVQRQFAGSQPENVNTRPVNTRQAKTKILVPNGQTAVIGGIYSSDETSTDSGMPGVKDIPVFGWLFKSKVETREKSELLIFLTPRILNAKDQSVAK